MTGNEIFPGALSTSGAGFHSSDAAERAPVWARLTAWMRAGRFDAMLAVGVPAPAGSALAVHATRLTSTAEREALARALRRAVHEAHDQSATLSLRVPLHRANITRSEDLIDAITLRLHSPRPVSPRGMARLRRLLSDGRGPFYQSGRGDLEGRLGAALAEL
jgi:hypothetical protein